MEELPQQLKNFLYIVALYCDEYTKRREDLPHGRYHVGHATEVVAKVELHNKFKAALSGAYEQIPEEYKDPTKLKTIILEDYSSSKNKDKEYNLVSFEKTVDRVLALATGEPTASLESFIFAAVVFVSEYAKGNKSGPMNGKTYGHASTAIEESRAFENHRNNLQNEFQKLAPEERDIPSIKALILYRYSGNQKSVARYDLISVAENIDRALAIATEEKAPSSLYKEPARPEDKPKNNVAVSAEECGLWG